ncbi:MAG: cytochrome C oxidase subunit IV family protein [Bdellovibrionales bacterium]|nr:cytochrome C oxidase subunit IV family protein [Bdellovibrionales bacterium]
MSGHHVVSVKTYTKVFVSLLILTILTVVAALFDFGAANTIIALLIASVKAGLVIAIFMGTKYDDKMSLVVLGVSMFFVILFFSIPALDIATRVKEMSTL